MITNELYKTIFVIAICIVVIIQFSLAFNDNWANKQFEKVKDEESTWVWLKVFKVPQTRENFFKAARIVSAIVVFLAILNIIWQIIKYQ
jgi:hypothetical protein